MNRELVISTLFDALQQPPMVFEFTADTTTGETALTNVSDTSGLQAGMPISGPGIEIGATLASIVPSVTLSLPAIADASAVALTQGFQTASRRLAHPSQEVDKPAMYLLDIGEEHPTRGSNSAYFAIIHSELWIYSDAGADPNSAFSPASALNNLIDAVEKVLNPSGSDPGGGFQQTFGLEGLLYARIEGEIQKDPGYDGKLAGCIIPIRIAVFTGLPTQFRSALRQQMEG